MQASNQCNCVLQDSENKWTVRGHSRRTWGEQASYPATFCKKGTWLFSDLPSCLGGRLTFNRICNAGLHLHLRDEQTVTTWVTIMVEGAWRRVWFPLWWQASQKQTQKIKIYIPSSLYFKRQPHQLLLEVGFLTPCPFTHAHLSNSLSGKSLPLKLSITVLKILLEIESKGLTWYTNLHHTSTDSPKSH